ncbi:hypothetical protein [Amycolatopsis sp. EV170708-02-1]|uniref:hypothetical protein n=1 Tax=Amycolatopsis sp. EV170708-02-1 TaxID=2919322 RepID=UPI001F0BB3DC|nr:hypothetical protein [Amycolatopsis sp. EV170708-02-1]UMP07222.1 hypothetical protein MJQ72_21490 [Amycolatopsis sp. EV170708-02-1]
MAGDELSGEVVEGVAGVFAGDVAAEEQADSPDAVQVGGIEPCVEQYLPEPSSDFAGVADADDGFDVDEGSARGVDPVVGVDRADEEVGVSPAIPSGMPVPGLPAFFSEFPEGSAFMR